MPSNRNMTRNECKIWDMVSSFMNATLALQKILAISGGYHVKADLRSLDPIFIYAEYYFGCGRPLFVYKRTLYI